MENINLKFKAIMQYTNTHFIQGHFYQNSNTVCRKELHIKESNDSLPDLLVIMMNPGASRPDGLKSYKDITDNQLNKLVDTIPDLTQKKVIDFMETKGLKYAVVLNLIDKCEPKSNNLTIDDTIFSMFNSLEKTKLILNSDFQSVDNVLIAWGCKKIFKALNKNILEVLKKSDKTIYGYPKNNCAEKVYFYHPLKRNEKWLEKVNEIIM